MPIEEGEAMKTTFCSLRRRVLVFAATLFSGPFVLSLSKHERTGSPTKRSPARSPSTGSGRTGWAFLVAAVSLVATAAAAQTVLDSPELYAGEKALYEGAKKEGM